MALSSSPLQILEQLDLLSGGTLVRRGDIRCLLDVARAGDAEATLDQLSFEAKFLTRCRGMMERIGPGGQGFDKLAAEFASAIGRAQSLLERLTAEMPSADRHRMEQEYRAANPESLESFLILCRDVMWYKNWKIDSR